VFCVLNGEENLFRVFILGRMRWAGCVLRAYDLRIAYTENSKGRARLVDLRPIEMDEDVGWVHGTH
jgi:hypothetical protein